MIVSKLELYNFRQFKSLGESPGLSVSFHKGLNALIGVNITDGQAHPIR